MQESYVGKRFNLENFDLKKSLLFLKILSNNSTGEILMRGNRYPSFK